LLPEHRTTAPRGLHAHADRIATHARQNDQGRLHDEKKPLFEHSYHILLVFVGTNLLISEQTNKTIADFILLFGQKYFRRSHGYGLVSETPNLFTGIA
jgi:hypothetical protein